MSVAEPLSGRLRRIYLDNAATTHVAPEVFSAMVPYLTHACGNPSSLHASGAQARDAVEVARESVASLIQCDPDELYFTSGGTESDNWALLGAAMAAGTGYPRIAVSSVEHHAVLHTAESLESHGYTLDRLPVDPDGVLNREAFNAALCRETAIVSVMHANNETGVIQPIPELSAACRASGILLHTDAVQSAGHIPIDLSREPVDLLSLSAHKMRGPKGVGALFVRRGIHLNPLLSGGGQERGRRSGTLNVPGIVGLGVAAQLAMAAMDTEARRVARLRDRLIEGIRHEIPDAVFPGICAQRLPGHALVLFPRVEGEALLLGLDEAGIDVSAGSACAAGAVEPSHVLLAMGVARDLARTAVRFTLGAETTEDDIERTVRVVGAEARSMRCPPRLHL